MSKLSNFTKLATKAAQRNCVNEAELMDWLVDLGREKLGQREAGGEASVLNERQEKAWGWLLSVGRKAMIREGSSEAFQASSVSGIPTWARKELDAGRQLDKLALSSAERFELADILDWMRSDNGPAIKSDWSKISLPQARDSEKKWVREQIREATKRMHENSEKDGIEQALDLSEMGEEWRGWSWVEVKSEAALDREGVLMRHCVGSYAKLVRDGRTRIFSLRTPESQPRMTIEAGANEIRQLRSFANSKIEPALAPAARFFIEDWKERQERAGQSIKFARGMWGAGFALIGGRLLVGMHDELGGSADQELECWIDSTRQAGEEGYRLMKEACLSLNHSGMNRVMGRVAERTDLTLSSEEDWAGIWLRIAAVQNLSPMLDRMLEQADVDKSGRLLNFLIKPPSSAIPAESESHSQADIFCFAAEAGNLELCQRIYQKAVDFWGAEAAQSCGKDFLTHALMGGNEVLIEWAIALRGGRPAEDEDLRLAIKRGSVAALAKMLESALPDSKPESLTKWRQMADSAMIMAAKRGKLELFDVVVAQMKMRGMEVSLGEALIQTAGAARGASEEASNNLEMARALILRLKDRPEELSAALPSAIQSAAGDQGAKAVLDFLIATMPDPDEASGHALEGAVRHKNFELIRQFPASMLTDEVILAGLEGGAWGECLESINFFAKRAGGGLDFTTPMMIAASNSPHILRAMIAHRPNMDLGEVLMTAMRMPGPSDEQDEVIRLLMARSDLRVSRARERKDRDGPKRTPLEAAIHELAKKSNDRESGAARVLSLLLEGHDSEKSLRLLLDAGLAPESVGWEPGRKEKLLPAEICVGTVEIGDRLRAARKSSLTSEPEGGPAQRV